MKDFKTITEYQLVYLARAELRRRIKEEKEIIKHFRLYDCSASRRARERLNMYETQLAEIEKEIKEIQEE